MNGPNRPILTILKSRLKSALINEQGFNYFFITENLGAVRELSKVTGHLGHRVEDLEKANETVAVRLANLNLRRSNSIKSTISSTDSTDSQEFKQRKRHSNSSSSRAKSLFQNKCVQMVLLAMISIIAVSMLAMASVYIYDYYDK